jgi:hypothetical protein
VQLLEQTTGIAEHGAILVAAPKWSGAGVAIVADWRRGRGRRKLVLVLVVMLVDVVRLVVLVMGMVLEKHLVRLMRGVLKGSRRRRRPKGGMARL